MRSSFFGLNVAVRGLYTAQRGLDTVNHNINNTNTPGYSRQVANQTASPAMAVYDGTGMVGTGSDVNSVDRVHDEYLDYKYWSENISYGEWSVKNTLLAEVETTFNEPSDNGFSAVLDDFFTAVQELSKDPSSLAARKNVIGTGTTVAKYFNSTATHFEKLQSDLNDSVKLKVDEINSLGAQIKKLNEQIYASEIDGNVANDLRDQRVVLVDKLSKIVNVQASEVVVGKLPSGRDDKHFVVTISGKALIDHYNLSKLKVVQRDQKLNVNEDIENLYDVKWEDGNTINITGGELKGYIDVRDGNEGLDEGNGQSPNYKGIPYYMKKLNEFVRKFTLAVNEGITETSDPADPNNKMYTKENLGHADGYGLKKPGSSTSPTGIRLFTVTGFSTVNNKYTELNSNEFINNTILINEYDENNDGDMADLGEDPNGNGVLDPEEAAQATGQVYFKNITAKNLCISGDLLNEQYAEYNIAASVTAGQAEDNGNILNILDMRENTHLFVEGTPEDFMKSLVSTLGIDAQQADMISTTQENFTKQLDNRRLSTSGVSLDEEMSNMVKYQHAYSAAAKMITTMAEIYDTLINRVGS